MCNIDRGNASVGGGERERRREIRSMLPLTQIVLTSLPENNKTSQHKHIQYMYTLHAPWHTLHPPCCLACFFSSFLLTALCVSVLYSWRRVEEAEDGKHKSIKAAITTSALSRSTQRDSSESKTLESRLTEAWGVDGKRGGISKLSKAQLKEEKGRFY